VAVIGRDLVVIAVRDSCRAMQLGGTGMVGVAVELGLDMNSSLVAGGTRLTNASTSSLTISTFERAVDLTATVGVIDADADCDDVRDSTSRSRPLRKGPTCNL
jgi:hypothetical protein